MTRRFHPVDVFGERPFAGHPTLGGGRAWLAAGAGTAIELRAKIGGGNFEDPATGGLNASVAQWLIGDGALPQRHVAAQGHALQRAGRVHAAREDGVIWVGGAVSPVVEGIVRP